MKHVVYIIVNYDTNLAYAGLTKQFSIRIAQHRIRKPFLFEGDSAVFKTRPMSAAKAQRIEAEAVRYLRLIGFNTTNTAKPGALGAPKERYLTKERCAAEALKYKTRADFRRCAISIYSTSQQKGWISEICSHMVLLQSPNGYWTKERCAAEALRFTTRSDFKTHAPSAYGAARREGWLDDICHHFVRERKPKGFWSKERCAEDASRYRTRGEFKQGSAVAHNAAYRNGWLDEVCSHMARRRALSLSPSRACE